MKFYSNLDLQGKLSDMNIALDSANSNISRQQMHNETNALREQNDKLQKQLETVFRERQNKENENTIIESQIGDERKKIINVIEKMPETEQMKYNHMENLVNKLNEENNKMHEQINEMINQKKNLETMIRTSIDRTEAVRLMTKLNELEMKLMNAKEDEQNRLSPEQQREKLINEVRENKQALTSIQHQIKIAEDTLTEKREILQQINQDLDDEHSDRHAKYKELRSRDTVMTEFMDTFKERLDKQKKGETIDFFFAQNVILFIFYFFLFSYCCSY